MSIELKIKQKHLALEPSIIRHEEEKLKQQMKHNRGEESSYWSLELKLQSLINHRRWDVRNEARATHLARAYLAGKPYSYVEKSRKKENEMTFQLQIINRIVAMVVKYGSGDQRKVDRDTIKAWSKLE